MVRGVSLVLLVGDGEFLELVDVVFMLFGEKVTLISMVSRGSMASTLATKASDSMGLPVSTRVGSQISRLLWAPDYLTSWMTTVKVASSLPLTTFCLNRIAFT